MIISTHTPLAGRDKTLDDTAALSVISTHTPLAGRVICFSWLSALNSDISTHTPLAGRDKVPSGFL